MKRTEANDPVALRVMGKEKLREGDYTSAFELTKKAAGLGDIDAHYNLACSYEEGEGVEKNMKKAWYHLEEAAIGGHAKARLKLGLYEGENLRFQRGVKHTIIAANLGCDEAIYALRELYELPTYSTGIVSKEDLDAAIRAHKAALDATKSRQRELAEEFWKDFAPI